MPEVTTALPFVIDSLASTPARSTSASAPALRIPSMLGGRVQQTAQSLTTWIQEGWFPTVNHSQSPTVNHPQSPTVGLIQSPTLDSVCRGSCHPVHPLYTSFTTTARLSQHFPAAKSHAARLVHRDAEPRGMRTLRTDRDAAEV